MLSTVMGEFRLSALFEAFFSLSFHDTNDCGIMLERFEY